MYQKYNIIPWVIITQGILNDDISNSGGIGIGEEQKTQLQEIYNKIITGDNFRITIVIQFDGSYPDSSQTPIKNNYTIVATIKDGKASCTIGGSSQVYWVHTSYYNYIKIVSIKYEKI